MSNPYKQRIAEKLGITMPVNGSWLNSIFVGVDNIVSVNVTKVDDLADLPTPIDGVIYLEAGKTYFITGVLDLMGNRLETLGRLSIVGTTSETSYITSTGLGVGIPLLTSKYTVPVKNLTFSDVDTAIFITDDGTAGEQVALDWLGVNFENIPNIGEIGTVDNFIFQVGAFLNSQNLKITGEVGTVGIESSIFVGNGSVGNLIEITNTANITRRFRVIYSSFVTFGSTIGINFSPDAQVLTESYILDTINFNNQDLALSGVTVNTNKTLFINCIGIQNTSVNGQLYMRGNEIATTILNTTDFFKVAGTTIASVDNEKYDATDNRLSNRAVIQRKYLVQATLSFSAGSNNVCEFGFYDSKLDDIREPSIQSATANTGGRAENIGMQCVVLHSDLDFIEVHARNTSGTASITVTDMNVIISEIK